jgi:hypothetical protein
MDPILNCIILACCDPLKRQEALTKFLARYVDETSAATCAKQLCEHFDFAPAGLLGPLVKEIARLARGADYKGEQ